MTGTNRPAVGIYSSTSRKAWAFFLPEIIVFDMGGGLLEPSLGRGAALCARDQRAQRLLKSYEGGNAHPGRGRKLKPMRIAPNVLWEPQSECSLPPVCTGVFPALFPEPPEPSWPQEGRGTALPEPCSQWGEGKPAWHLGSMRCLWAPLRLHKCV